MMFSLILPVYNNEETIRPLLARLQKISGELDNRFEAVFVVDGSPDSSLELLEALLPSSGLNAQVIALSRNFGAFSAILAGLEVARGESFGVMAADLQEPPELVLAFWDHLAHGDCDVVVGRRMRRADPLSSRLASALFWATYRKFIQPEVPRGGVDVFACNTLVRNHLVRLRELNSTLVGLLYWVGFRRVEVAYTRQERSSGRSSWSFRKRLRYLLDSVFAFSDLPVRLLTLAGILGIAIALLFGMIVVGSKVSGALEVPGYAATIITVIFFGALNSLGLGLIGEYLWRTFENTKKRPNFIISRRLEYTPNGSENVANGN